MKTVMVSNYINHHQIPFCEAMYERLGDDFVFIQTEAMEAERADMGWSADVSSIPYVKCSYEAYEETKALIMDCDLLIAGWTKSPELYEERLAAGKLTFRLSERLYREGQWKFISPKGLINKYKEHIRYRKKPVFALCVGAYVASDFNLIGAYPGKRYKFGYFPATKEYAWDKLYEKKGMLHTVEVEKKEYLPEEPPVLTDKEINIVWAGRFLPLKHPEYAVMLTRDLVKKGYRFHLHLIGDGEMADELRSYLQDEMIEDYVTMYGFLEPDKVREIMEKSHIHIFTSNFIEGWGAVVNEGMNSGCAEIVNDEVGCARYLINDNVNGLLYHEGKYQDLLSKVLYLFENPSEIERLGLAAYETIVKEWNAKTSADRIIDFYKNYEKGNISPCPHGPMSVAELIKPGFFKTGKL